jgi:hypothetical protein
MMVNERNVDYEDWVPIAEFTPAEERLARVIVTMARGGGTMFRGRRAECQVAVALGARHPAIGTSPWDLMLPDGRTIEVKSTAGQAGFSIGRTARDVDLWVFVHCGATEADDRFTIVTNDVVDRERARFRSERLSVMRLSPKVVRGWGLHTSVELSAAVPPKSA